MLCFTGGRLQEGKRYPLFLATSSDIWYELPAICGIRTLALLLYFSCANFARCSALVRRRRSCNVPQQLSSLSCARDLFIIVRLSYSKWLAFFLRLFPKFLFLMMDSFLPLAYLINKNLAATMTPSLELLFFGYHLPQCCLPLLNCSTPTRRV